MKARIELRCSPEIKELATRLAIEENRSLTNYIINLILEDKKRKGESKMNKFTLKDYGRDLYLIEETKEIARNNPETGNLEVLTRNGSPLEVDEFGVPIIPHFSYQHWIEKYKPIEKTIYDEDGEVYGYEIIGYKLI